VKTRFNPRFKLANVLFSWSLCSRAVSWPKISWLPSNLLLLSTPEDVAPEAWLSGSYLEELQSFLLISKYFIFYVAKKPEQRL